MYEEMFSLVVLLIVCFVALYHGEVHMSDADCGDFWFCELFPTYQQNVSCTQTIKCQPQQSIECQQNTTYAQTVTCQQQQNAECQYRKDKINYEVY